MKNLLRRIKNKIIVPVKAPDIRPVLDPSKQDLGLYWDPEFARVLETWGEDHAWNEIQMFLATSKGRVLDIACGTGVTIDIVARNKRLEVHGCDISDYLIQK